MTRSIRTLLTRAAVVPAAVAMLALVLASPVRAGEDDNHHPAPRPGAACPDDKVGKTSQLQTRNGLQTYRCEQRPDDDCPVWHWVYDPGVPVGQTPADRCPQCPTSPPATTAPPTVPPSVPTVVPPVVEPPAQRATLPVTGDLSLPPWLLACAVLAVVVGAGLYRIGRRRPDGHP